MRHLQEKGYSIHNWVRIWLFRCGILVLHLILTWPVAAHGPIQEQITLVTAQIAQDPTNAHLYLDRGELHRIHCDWAAALRDCVSAAGLDPHLAEVELCGGKTMLDAGWLKPGKILLNSFLSKKPDHADALVTRARLLIKLHQYVAASRDFTRAITQLAYPRPEYYLERAQALAAGGDEYIAEALRGLDEGLERLKQPVSLQIYAIELELKKGRCDAALSRLDQIAAQSADQTTWLARRGEILAGAGRFDAARVAFMETLIAIDTLPPQRGKTPTIIKLKARVCAALGKLP